MSADESMDGMPIDPLCPVHGIVALPVSPLANTLAISALSDQQAAEQLEHYRHHGALHAEYFRSLVVGTLPIELAVIMTREMANVYWNIELRK